MTLMIFTGLNEIFLEPQDCDYQTIKTTIKQLQQKNIALIPVTNNTRAEVEELLLKLDLNVPFAVEAGSGIFIPQANHSFKISETETIETVDHYHLYQLGCTYTEARAALKVVQEEISKILRGFGDLDESNIKTMMGVSSAAAKRAKSREFSEYFLTPSRLEISKLQAVAEDYGFKIIPENKLSLVVGGGAGKEQAIKWFQENYQSANGAEIITVGLGSTAQDLDLLEAVDRPIIIPAQTGVAPDLANKNWQIETETGSVAWIKAIAKLINSY